MNIYTSVVTVLMTFLCTGLAANWLVQKWQYRNWLNQQKFLGAEKKYEALKLHADEVSKLSAKRLSAMFRLVAALDQSADRLEERRKIYSDVLDEWGQHINSFYYKTTLYFDWEMTQRLEYDINQRFVEVGSQIEHCIRRRQEHADAEISEKEVLKDELFSIQGALGNFNRDMLKYVIRRQDSTYHGVEVGYSYADLQYLSNWQLIKALFITRVEEFSVTLTSFELERPARSRD